MAFSLGNTYSLLQALKLVYPVPSLFLDTFFPNNKNFVTPTVLMDYKKGGRKMAPFVAKSGGFKNIGREGFSTWEYEPPLIGPARKMSIQDIDKRGFGENIVSDVTPEERAAKMTADDLADLQENIDRRREWMCINLLLYGAFTAEGESDDGKVKFSDTITYADWTQKLTLSGTDMWSNTGADIYGVFSDMYHTIGQSAGRTPDVVITTQKTVNYMLKNEELLKWLLRPADQLKIATVAPRIVSTDVTYFGSISALNGIQIYTYDAQYSDDSGTLKPYIPDGYLVMGIKGRGQMLNGLITQMEMDNNFHSYSATYVPKVWSEIGGDTRMIRLASKCVPKPYDINDWFTLKAY